jgi:hypothetical protein
LWLATFGCWAGGLLVTLALTRPLILGVLAKGAVFALAFPLGFATIGLVITLRRPANPLRLHRRQCYPARSGGRQVYSWDADHGRHPP